METDINIVQHKILETLRRVALTVSKEHDKLQIETATLHFTTLVAYLNDFEKYSKYEASNSTFLHQKKIPCIDITINVVSSPKNCTV